MTRIYVTTYEIVGDGIALANAHHAKIKAAQALHWEFAEKVGGFGFRPHSFGGFRSVFFKELPAGWRKVGMDRGYIEAVPRKDSKLGKELLAQMQQLPTAPQTDQLAANFGYSPPEMAIEPSNGRIYFATEVSVAYPAERHFLRLPRFAGDQFTPNEATLRAIPESELLKAVEDHNNEARRLREGGAA